LPDITDWLEHLARYITSAPLRLDAISRTEDGRMKVRTPPAPQTGKTSMELDPLELIHRICAQIPAPGQHLVRYYGWYGNRARGARKEHGVGVPVEVSLPSTPRSRNWARLLRKIFEVDPMLCPQCGVKMLPVSIVQEVGGARVGKMRSCAAIEERENGECGGRGRGDADTIHPGFEDLVDPVAVRALFGAQVPTPLQ